MRYLLILSLVIISFNSFAGKMMFGKDQKIHFIEPQFEIPLFDDKGYQLVDSNETPIIGRLAYLVETQFFVAGVWVNDGGYVLSMDKETYYPISESVQKITEASIEKNFPAYSLNTIDYIFGYSLWLILAGVIGYYVIKDRIVKKRAQKKSTV